MVIPIGTNKQELNAVPAPCGLAGFLAQPSVLVLLLPPFGEFAVFHPSGGCHQDIGFGVCHPG